MGNRVGSLVLTLLSLEPRILRRRLSCAERRGGFHHEVAPPSKPELGLAVSRTRQSLCKLQQRRKERSHVDGGRSDPKRKFTQTWSEIVSFLRYSRVELCTDWAVKELLQRCCVLLLCLQLLILLFFFPVTNGKEGALSYVAESYMITAC